MQSSGYGAESGRAGGAVVNVVTKSGTNQWHGSTFYYLRDSSLGGAAPPFVGFNPTDQQHQFGATIGGPIQRNKTFLFAGYDQHIFHVPAVVEFENGSTAVVPQLGTYPSPGDYEVCDPAIGGMACDQALVFASAAQLSTLGGTFHAKLLGETGFVKLDRVLTPHQFLSARLSTSRYYGTNNVSFDPASPITNYAMSGNGEEDVKTESASLSLLSSITPRLTSHLRVQFSRDLEQSFPKYDRGADEYLQLDAGFGAIVDLAAADAGTPAAPGGDLESEPGAKPVEVWRRRDADLGLRLLPVAL